MNEPRWTLLQIMLKKPIKFLALSIILIYFLIELSDKVIPRLPLFENDVFIVSLLLFLIILGGYLSATILKLIANTRLSRMDPEDAEATYEYESRIKWNKLYSIVIAYFVVGLMFKVSNSFIIPLLWQFEIGSIGSFLGGVVLIVLALGIPFLCGFLTVRFFNRFMVRLTGTNEELIRDFTRGFFDDQIPNRFRNKKSLVGILHILEDAEATSIKGAIVRYQVKVIIIGFYKAAGAVAGVFALLIVLLSFGCMNIVEGEIRNMANGVKYDIRRERAINDIADAVIRRL